MTIENRTFTLVGKFDDKITSGLAKVNKELDKLSKFGKGSSTLFKGAQKSVSLLNIELKGTQKNLKVIQNQLKQIDKFKFKFDKTGIKSAQDEVKILGKNIDGLNKSFQFDKSGIKAAQDEVRVLGREIDDVAKRGFNFDKSGIQAAQQEASVLGNILKANALIEGSRGVAQAGGAGIRGGLAAINKIGGFIAARAKDAAKDQLQDVQARGSLFGALNKAELFANAKNISDQKKLQEINENNYDTTRSISRSMEGSIADVVKSSTVATSTITTLSRQLSDNLLPSMLKAKGITDLSQFQGPEGRKGLDKVMGGEKGVGKELATLFEQMGSIITGPQYAPQAAMGFTQFLGQGTINKQLSIFENNPVLVDAMKKYAKEFGETTEGRIKALKKALEVAMPEAALAEARQTLMGGIQSVSDTLTNANAGILSMGADIAGQGQKTLQMARKNGVIAKQEAAFARRQGELRKTWSSEKARTDLELKNRDAMEAEQRRKYSKGLVRLYENADSPMEIIAATFGPLLQKFADFLGSTRNLFIDPVVAIMDRLQTPFAQLMDNLDALGSDVRKGEKTLAEALGRFFAELFKSFATLFDPEGVAEQGGNAMQKAFQDFAKGFKSIDGQKYLDIIMNGIGDFLMKALFNEGNALQGLTPLGDALGKAFLLLAAPAFISSLITGLLPLAIYGMGGMIFETLIGLGPKIAASSAANKAAKLATAQKAAAAAKNARFASMALGAAPVAAAAAPGAGSAAVGGLASIPVAGWVAALAAAVVVFEKPIMALTNTMQKIGKKMQKSSNWLTSSFGQVVQGIGQLFGGITKFFNGLWNIVSGLLSGDTNKVVDGIKKLFSGIADIIVGVGRSIGGLGGMIVGAVTNLFKVIGELILKAASKIPGLGFLDPDNNGAPGPALNNPGTGQLPILGLPPAPGTIPPTPTFVFKPELKPTFVVTPNKNNTPTSVTKPGSLIGGADFSAFGKPSKPPAKPKTKSEAKGSAHPFVGNLGQAINYEMANKPPGSDLVIANSYEKIYPPGKSPVLTAAKGLNMGGAAGGLGMGEFMATLSGGFTKVATLIAQSAQQTRQFTSAESTAVSGLVSTKFNESKIRDERQTTVFNNFKTSSDQKWNQNNDRLLALQQQLTKMAMTAGGSMLGIGGPGGNVISIGKQLLAMGLQVGENPFFQYGQGFLPNGGGRIGGHAQGSYHYQGRALDVSGPPGQLDQVYAMLKGTNPSELLWRVPGHFDHLHVAYALGAGNPAFFNSQEQALAWEKKASLGNVKLSSITSRQGEFNSGGDINITAPITINQQPGQDAEALATMVAIKLGDEINRLRSSSIIG